MRQDRQATYQAAAGLPGDRTRSTPRRPAARAPGRARPAALSGLQPRRHPENRVALANGANLHAIEQRFAARYQRFEERFQNMLDYIHLRSGQNRCRSAYLVNYLTGENSATPAANAICAARPANTSPGDPTLSSQPNRCGIDPRMAMLGAVRDHNSIFGRWTIEKMLLGIPQTTFQGQAQETLAHGAASDHFGELEGSGINADQVRRALDALIEGGYLQLVERPLRGSRRDLPGRQQSRRRGAMRWPVALNFQPLQGVRSVV